MLQKLKNYENAMFLIKPTGWALFLAVTFFVLVPYGIAAKGEITAEIVRSRELVEDRRTAAILRLEHQESGFPVMMEELAVMHTERIHLLIVDPTLTDYHHEHPREMETPGNYIFTMTPRTKCGYRIWADLYSKNSGQQYVMTDIAGAEDCKDKQINQKTNMEFSDENYRFTLEFDTGQLAVGKDTMAKLIVREVGGRYVSELEPIMGAYAHMVGFYDDYETIAHLHPMGEEPTSYTDRGGPMLDFHMKPEKKGFMRLFLQVQINGQVVFADFGVEVRDRAEDMKKLFSPVKSPTLFKNRTVSEKPRTPESTVKDSELRKMLEAENKKYEERQQQPPTSSQDIEGLFSGGTRPSDNQIYENLEQQLLDMAPKYDHNQ